MVSIGFGEYSVTTWGGYPAGVRYDDGALQLWKATDGRGNDAYFTAPRDAEPWFLSVIAEALLGRPVHTNGADLLTGLDGVPREGVPST